MEEAGGSLAKKVNELINNIKNNEENDNSNISYLMSQIEKFKTALRDLELNFEDKFDSQQMDIDKKFKTQGKLMKQNHSSKDKDKFEKDDKNDGGSPRKFSKKEKPLDKKDLAK